MASSHNSFRFCVGVWFFILLCFCAGCGTSSLPEQPLSSETSHVVVNPKTGTAPLTVRFKLYPSTYIDPDTNIWYMGDGTEVENKLEFTYTYSRAGTFPVRLSLRNNFSKAKKYYHSFVTLPTICVYDNANPERYDYVKTISLSSSRYFSDIATDSSGNIYATGRSGDNYVYVISFSSSGNKLTTWKITSTTDTGSKTKYSYYKIALDTKDNVYAMDTSNNVVYKFDKDGNSIKEWGVCNPSDEDDSCQNDRGRPYEITTDTYDNLYVLESTYNDFSNNLEEWVLKFNSEGSFVSRVNLLESYTLAVTKIAVDLNGKIYALMETAPYVMEYSSTGELIREWGDYGNFDGELKYPQDVKTDPEGNVFFTDLYSKKVNKFDASGSFVTKFGVCENEGLPDLEELELIKDGTVYALNSTLTKITVFKKRTSKI